MIELSHGDLLKANVDALVNTVNCVGVMGKGVALQFKKAYPDNFIAYQKACKKGEIHPGRMFVYFTGKIIGPRFIINFPTKKHWKTLSKVEYIQEGLDDLVSVIRKLGINSIALPPLGCGNGGLEWDVIYPLIKEKLASLSDVSIFLFEPAGAPATEQIINTKTPNLTIFRAVLLKLIDRYIYWQDSLSRLEIQKLSYFQKEAGDPIFKQLIFVSGKYGPYARGLGHLIQALDGHFLKNCGDSEDPLHQIYLVPEVIKTTENYLAENSPKSNQYLERVFNLIDGFETPFGMELLATVHWVANYYQYPARNIDEAYEYVIEWNKHKKDLFKPKHVEIAWNRLVEQGWIIL